MKRTENGTIERAGRRLSGLAAAALVAGILITASPGGEPQAATPPVSRPRERILLSEGWRFATTEVGVAAAARRFDDRRWPTVSVPHTWGPEPKRGWYRLRFRVAPEDLGGRRVYLSFEGVSVYADVFVNGRHLGQHRGAFTRFTMDATPYLSPGDNLLAVRANNKPADTIDSLPSPRGKQLYKLYGGIYRKVWLLRTAAVHIDPLDLGTSGVYLTPTNVSSESAELKVRTLLRNGGPAPVRVEVRNRLLDADGREVAAFSGKATVAAGRTAEVKTSQTVARPRLWSPGAPHLYTVRSTLIVAGREVDEVRERTGFRSFTFDGKGFFLNGLPILLRGVGKHQENAERLSALTDDDLRADFDLLDDLGVNFVRLAHYPHAPLAYDLADEKGILVWAENGHSNEIKLSGETGVKITREMVRQNYNHPSVVIWGVGNETQNIQVPRYTATARAEDPNRLIGYATNIEAPSLLQVVDILALNTYPGWYSGQARHFEGDALEWRFISETGGGAVITHHTDYADIRHEVDVFEPEEYRELLEEVHDQVVFREHPEAVPLFSTWILRDFATNKFKGWNTKGLVAKGGFRKDAWYLYRSFLRPDAPLVHIAGKTYFLRSGASDNGIKAYGNVPTLNLTVNGVPGGARHNGDYSRLKTGTIANVFYWKVKLHEGRNEVVVSDGAATDRAIVYYGHVPPTELPPGSLVRDLRSSNSESPAWFIDAPVQDHWPFYYPMDGSADNTFGVLPEEVRGASWISTPRLSDPLTRTDLSFTLTRDATVYAMGEDSPPLAESLRAAGFTQTAARGFWWNHDLKRVPYRLWERSAQAGEVIHLSAVTADYVLMMKPR